MAQINVKKCVHNYVQSETQDEQVASTSQDWDIEPQTLNTPKLSQSLSKQYVYNNLYAEHDDEDVSIKSNRQGRFEIDNSIATGHLLNETSTNSATIKNRVKHAFSDPYQTYKSEIGKTLVQASPFGKEVTNQKCTDIKPKENIDVQIQNAKPEVILFFDEHLRRSFQISGFRKPEQQHDSLARIEVINDKETAEWPSELTILKDKSEKRRSTPELCLDTVKRDSVVLKTGESINPNWTGIIDVHVGNKAHVNSKKKVEEGNDTVSLNFICIFTIIANYNQFYNNFY